MLDAGGTWLGGLAGRTADDSPLSDSRWCWVRTDPGRRSDAVRRTGQKVGNGLTERVLLGAAPAHPAGYRVSPDSGRVDGEEGKDVYAGRY